MKKVLFICLTMVGSMSMAQNTNLGTNAGNAGSGNTSLGYYAGNNVTGYNNTFTGINAGANTTYGSYNVFTGSYSGINASGVMNTFNGYNSGHANQGDKNTFIGALAGNANGSGSYNTFTGSEAGQKSQGSENTFTGYRSGYFNSSDRNAFYGSYSGNKNTGSDNTFVGYKAGEVNKQASYNTFIGGYAGKGNISGNSNTFLGARVGYNNNNGAYNVFLGTQAGFNNVDGAYNVFLGTLAGYSNVSGQQNVIIGYRAGVGVSGNGNVLIGSHAGYGMSGSNKLYIENSTSGTPLIYGDFDSESIGLGTTTPGAYRLYVNGDAYATGLWVSSDKQFKTAGKEINSALEKVVAIKGHAYEFKQNVGLKKFSEGTHFGFYAQELQKVLPELVREDEDGYLAVNYIEMIPVLTEALKELVDKQTKLDVYEQRLNKIELMLAELSGKNSSESNTLQNKPSILNYSLGNRPNPAQNETVIEYALPEDTANASIIVFDLQGNEVLTKTNLNNGNGELTISSNMIGKGLFNYVLIVDGEIVLTRKMIIR